MHTEIGTSVQAAAQYLRSGQLVAVPTETVYGLAGNAMRPEVLAQIFEVKSRPTFDPLIVHGANREALAPLVTSWPDEALRLADAFWPGPLTLVLPRTHLVPDLVTAGLETVAVRVPDHPMMQALLQSLDFPLAAPSANPFGYISPTTATHVHDQLGRLIPYILDGGPCHVGLESTIVSVIPGQPLRLLRRGGLASEAIERIVGPLASATDAGQALAQLHPQAPGQLVSHYAPRTRLRVGSWAQREELFPLVPAQQLGYLAFDTLIDKRFESEPLPGGQLVLTSAGNLTKAAQNLFASMRQIDALGLAGIIAQPAPNQGLGLAINDRLRRASS
jgi:L-threonylcarbamoyladenylate synthase